MDLHVFFSTQFYIRINQIWKNVSESILSKVDNIFNRKSKALGQKISEEFVNLIQLKYECKH